MELVIILTQRHHLKNHRMMIRIVLFEQIMIVGIARIGIAGGPEGFHYIDYIDDVQIKLRVDFSFRAGDVIHDMIVGAPFIRSHSVLVLRHSSLSD